MEWDDEIVESGIYIADDNLSDDDDLALIHYGTKRHSGRYPWGSGEDPYQHDLDFLARIADMKEQGLKTDDQLAKAFGMSRNEFNAQKALATQHRKSEIYRDAKKLKKRGMTNVEIGKILGSHYYPHGEPIPEGTIREYLTADDIAKKNIAERTADSLQKIVDKKGMIDVGKGTNQEIGISKTKFSYALAILKNRGYDIRSLRVEQATNPGKFTLVKVLCKPGTKPQDVYQYDQIGSITDYNYDENSDEFQKKTFHYPESLDSSRLAVRYPDGSIEGISKEYKKADYGIDNGASKDGLIEIRRGVPDLSLGNSHYAQVRILVDGSHYIKGMAAYSDNLPDGVDIVFNTSKKPGTPIKDDKTHSESVLKKIKKDDPTNPFGSTIKTEDQGGQYYYTDPKTGEKKLGLINKKSDEGDWLNWDHTHLSSQFLSKQPLQAIRKQLNLAEQSKQEEFDDIAAINNPSVKKKLLENFADDADKAAVELQAAGYAGQLYEVILPMTTIKDTEVYAPNYKDGTKVALVRFPHAGTFEIPIRTVNNKYAEGKSMIGPNGADAIGISHSTANQLSGADFDGDTVMVIPIQGDTNVRADHPFKELVNFDTKLSYGADKVVKAEDSPDGKDHYYRGGRPYKVMSEGMKQREMGIVSNLITDMTIEGASDDEKVRAVKYSMVVIDAAKHHLDYESCYNDMGIDQLVRTYQKKPEKGKYGGASTLISRAGSPKVIPERQADKFIAKDTGNELQVMNPDETVAERRLYKDPKTGKVYRASEKANVQFDPKTGEKYYHETGRVHYSISYKDKNGKTVKGAPYLKTPEGRYKPFKMTDGDPDPKKLYYKDIDTGEFLNVEENGAKLSKPIIATTSVSQMELVNDARKLSSGNVIENAYADYANKMKALANRARVEELTIKPIQYSKASREIYKDQYESLRYKLGQAEANAPRERQAQLYAKSLSDAMIKKKEADGEQLDNEHKKKIRQDNITLARTKFGAKGYNIEITPKEWEAIQAGAISQHMMDDIVKHADLKILRDLATPSNRKTITRTRYNRLKSLAANGYTNSEIADAVGLSASTVTKYLNGTLEPRS